MLAAFLGTLCLLNLLVETIGGFNANIWWIDLRPLPATAATVLQLLAAAALLAIAAGWRRLTVQAILALLFLIAFANGCGFYVLLAKGRIHGWPLSFSLLVAVALGVILYSTTKPKKPFLTRYALLTAVFCVVAFPLAQMFSFGKTDYTRPADAIVVLGAHAYADGTPSHALADRVRTACDLYHQGYARHLIFSGGPGDGTLTEPEVMRNFAVAHGVPADAITLDPLGLNTAATVRNTLPILSDARGVLVVSHFYHLPRIKLSYQQAGRDVFTVPARQGKPLTQMPFNIAREVAALWVYYLRGL
jgi:vancomycin permeability regulator SanA